MKWLSENRAIVWQGQVGEIITSLCDSVTSQRADFEKWSEQRV